MHYKIKYTWTGKVKSSGAIYHHGSVIVLPGLHRHRLCHVDPLLVLFLHLAGHKHTHCSNCGILNSSTADTIMAGSQFTQRHLFFTVKLCGFTVSFGHPAFCRASNRGRTCQREENQIQFFTPACLSPALKRRDESTLRIVNFWL